MNAILLSLALWFSTPTPGEHILVVDGKTIAVLTDFKLIQIVRLAEGTYENDELVCEYKRKDKRP